MIHILVHTHVQDYARWRSSFRQAGPMRRSHGSLEGDQGPLIFQNTQDPNEVFILFEWESLDKAQQFGQSDDLRRATMQAGVVGQPEVFFLEKAEEWERAKP